MEFTAHTRRNTRVTRGLILVLALCLTLGVASQASAATYNPQAVISDANFRDYDSMSEAEVQAFLEAQPGVLKTLKTADYDKVITLSKKTSNLNITPDKGETPKTAAHIIWEACQQWKISPKVMLVMLQKEQSLLTNVPTKGSTTLARAIGAGCPGSLVQNYAPYYNKVATNRYPGFGNQMWFGTRLFDGYGEQKNGSTIALFTPGISRTVYKIDNITHIHPTNLATYKLYVYNPSIGAKMPYGDLSGQSCTGNANFWKLYRKYFGDTYANPRMQNVYRFRNKKSGTYLFTTSVVERYHLASKHSADWAYSGPKFSVDTSVTAATVPLYHFYNSKTGQHSYTRSQATYNSRRSASGAKTWKYRGIAFRVSTKPAAGNVTVYSMHNKRTGADLLTSSRGEIDSSRRTLAGRRVWAHESFAFYLPRLADN